MASKTFDWYNINIFSRKPSNASSHPYLWGFDPRFIRMLAPCLYYCGIYEYDSFYETASVSNFSSEGGEAFMYGNLGIFDDDVGYGGPPGNAN